MALTLRPTGGHSPVYRDRQDWTIFEDGRPIGRLYESNSTGMPADLRWFWSITVYVHPNAGIVTSGKVASLEQAKADFRQSWERARTHMQAHDARWQETADAATRRQHPEHYW
jgi:hypothetical protein